MTKTMPRSPAATARFQQINDLGDQGLTRPEIADRLGTSIHIVNYGLDTWNPPAAEQPLVERRCLGCGKTILVPRLRFMCDGCGDFAAAATLVAL